ncbi:hypothetical protein A8C32_11335 [Flavivirga aquatica]|uniref:NarX-like N-terminal domain-containing protein n=1 Tax=Flavivirga aquatica TaxID=1849968 RepID=A0A1E5TD78_9FLAO|nr:type IV pili methyl-accepting chemotaxis transducer N-terminal domain-containing protein [Flavivirga aquatica]OEK09309.1 hypothetical protein A8C32_11335 [Flavivirga aquatica]
MVLKNTIIIFSFVFLNINKLSSQSQNYGTIDYNKAINISGKQRMLSQKMAKAYLLLTKGVNNEKIKRELNSSKFIFKKQLEILRENATSSSVKLYIKNVDKLWEAFKILISSPVNLNDSERIMKLNSKLLSACHELVESIEARSNYDNRFFENNNQELMKIINVSGKQRMLSQRLCLYYTAITMFPKDKTEYQEILGQVFDEFDGVIGYLLINGYNTTESEEELGAVMAMWEKIQSNKKGFLDGEFDLEDVFNVTNDLTKSFNKITGIYEIVSKTY